MILSLAVVRANVAEEMAERSPGQELARRRLGDALRGYREQANVRLDAAARELECSTAKISRLENGLGPAKLWEVRVLLDLYAVDAAERGRLEEWARGSKKPGWWEEEIADLLPSLSDDTNLLLAAETEASRLKIYSTPVLPALLQTAEYAAAHMHPFRPEWSESAVARFTDVLRKRQEGMLRTTDPVRLDVVLDEGAVRRVVGGPDVHRAQLQWLADTLDAFATQGRDTLHVQVLPFSAGVPSRALSAFMVIEPRQPRLDRPMVLLENTVGGSWASVEDVEDVVSVFAELTDLALDSERTSDFVRQVINTL